MRNTGSEDANANAARKIAQEQRREAAKNVTKAAAHAGRGKRAV